MIDPDNEAHVMAVAEAMFDLKAKNRGKLFKDASTAIRYRIADEAAWVLSMASKTISELQY